MPPKRAPAVVAAASTGSRASQSASSPEPSQMDEILQSLRTMNDRMSSIERRLDAQSPANTEQLVRTILRESTVETVELPSPPPPARHTTDTGRQGTDTRAAEYKDIGIFDPSQALESVYSDKREIVYSDVTLFIRKVNRVAERKRVASTTVVDCLRGNAIAWFEALSEEEMDNLEHGQFKDLLKALQAQFGIKRDSALSQLQFTKYNLDHASNNSLLTLYFDRICRLGRALDYTQDQQKDWIFAGMYNEIQQLFIDSKDLSLQDLRRRLDERQTIVFHSFRYRNAPRALPAPENNAAPKVANVGANSDRETAARIRQHTADKNYRRAYFMGLDQNKSVEEVDDDGHLEL